MRISDWSSDVCSSDLSALAMIHHPWKLLALPAGGLMLVFLARGLKNRKRVPVDVVEANALHGGRIPFADNLVIASQTLISNGAGRLEGRRVGKWCDSTCRSRWARSF